MNSSDYKVLAILRESTTRQEIESQKQELTEFLIGKGFKADEIDYIEAQGASARKANAKYIDFLADIKNRIETNPSIRTVGLWHLNRLGRIKKYLTDMEHYFVTNGVQMYVKNGFDMPLLGADGKETIGASIAFSVYAAMVEVETDEMFEKTQRGKARNKDEGKYNGGKIKLGFVLNRDKRFEIHPENAEIVRRIYTMFVEEDISCNAIYHHFAALGVFKPANRLQAGSKVISRILNDKANIGEGLYPAIVSRELYDKAVAKLALFPKRHDTKNIYFCRGLLKDTKTGTTFTAARGTLVYHIRYLDHCVGLNLNVMDWMIWFVASYLKNHAMRADRVKNKEVYADRLHENTIKVSTFEKEIEELRKQIDRAIEMNILQPKHFSSEKMNAVVSRCDSQIERLTDEITRLKTDNARMEKFISDEVKADGYINFAESDLTDTMKKEIIDSVIDRVEVTKVEQGKYNIQFINKIGYIDNSYWVYRFEGHKIYVEMIDANGTRIDFSPVARKFKRFDRNRYDRK